jgi:antitoxin (DNA-binding transcriptional repressor) of toxin-antitoxin stability system
MAIISMRELSREPRKVLEALESLDDAEACLITRHGKPLAALVPVGDADAEEFLIAASPELAQSRRDADQALAAGNTVSLSEFAERLGVDLEAEDALAAEDVEELIEEVASEAQAALAQAGTGEDSGESDTRFLEAEALLQMNNVLLEYFVEAVPSGMKGADAPAGKPATAVKTLVGFNKAAEPLADQDPSPYEVYVSGAVDGVQRYRELLNLEPVGKPGRLTRILVRKKARAR